MVNQWIKIDSKNLPEPGIEVIGFSPEWIHEDFNTNGTRVCFLNGDEGFFSAQWNDYQDTYDNSEVMPTHWMPMPIMPKGEPINPNQLNAFEANQNQDILIKAANILLMYGHNFEFCHDTDLRFRALIITNEDGITNLAIKVVETDTSVQIIYQDGTAKTLRDTKELGFFFPYYPPN